MKNEMPKVKNIVIDEFVINNPKEKQPFMIKDVELVFKRNKEGKGFYEIKQDGKRIGVLVGNKKVIFTEKYLLELHEFDEKYFEKIGLNGALEIEDFDEMIKNQEQKNLRKINEQKGINQIENSEITENNNKNIDNHKLKNNQEIKNKSNNQKEKNNKDITMDDLKKYNYEKIDDPNFAKRIVDPYEYDIDNIVFIKQGNTFKPMVKELNSDKLVEIETKEDVNELGEIDNIQNNKEINEGKGRSLKFIDRQTGGRIDVNIKQDSSTLQIGYSIDVDGDGKKESGRIRTKSYRPTQQASDLMEKLKKSGRYNINDEKDDLGVETPEINEDAPLSDLQLKEELSKLSEPVRRIVTAKIDPKENPKLDELNEYIVEAEMMNPEEVEIEKENYNEREEEWDWDSEDEHEKHRRPPVY